jgi:hypothetical protein
MPLQLQNWLILVAYLQDLSKYNVLPFSFNPVVDKSASVGDRDDDDFSLKRVITPGPFIDCRMLDITPPGLENVTKQKEQNNSDVSCFTTVPPPGYSLTIWYKV